MKKKKPKKHQFFLQIHNEVNGTSFGKVFKLSTKSFFARGLRENYYPCSTSGVGVGWSYEPWCPIVSKEMDLDSLNLSSGEVMSTFYLESQGTWEEV